MGKGIVLFLHNFAKDDTLVGKHLLIANLTYLQTFRYVTNGNNVGDFYVHIRTRPHEHIVKMIESFGFKIIGDEVFSREFEAYLFAGTGVAKVIQPAGTHKPFVSLKNAINRFKKVVRYSGTDFNRSSAKWYIKVLEYLSDKPKVYNTIIDPVYDCTIKDFEPVYFCDYYKGNGVEIDNRNTNHSSISVNFRWLYMGYVYKEYFDKSVINKINVCYSIFNNVKRFNKKRYNSLMSATVKGIDIGTDKSDLIYSINDYMSNVQKVRFTLVTYSYDERTISLLRLLDALALGTLPLIAVSFNDLSKIMGDIFAEYCRKSGIIVNEKDFCLRKIKAITNDKHKEIIKTLTEILTSYETDSIITY